MASKRELTEERAYHLWRSRGSPDGSPEVDWYEAELQLDAKIDESVNDTFPASDPPSSHLPDVPPANAQAKWETAQKSPATPRKAGR
jgi:Protein of unknown function (DUF2934)